MLSTTAKIKTDRASTYLQQLCKHFGHKVPVTFDTQSGQIVFPFGQCGLSADPKGLSLTVQAETQTDLSKGAHVLSSHLERFAFRENPKISWQVSATPQA